MFKKHVSNKSFLTRSEPVSRSRWNIVNQNTRNPNINKSLRLLFLYHYVSIRQRKHFWIRISFLRLSSYTTFQIYLFEVESIEIPRGTVGCRCDPLFKVLILPAPRLFYKVTKRREIVLRRFEANHIVSVAYQMIVIQRNKQVISRLMEDRSVILQLAGNMEQLCSLHVSPFTR